jgi:crotonobetainyl-CoA:carnitine CoA-transferase CaiB-like acyl-CoA transferase
VTLASLPLSGIRVVDLSANIAGPYAAMVLGDLGADVLKVEPPGGDDARRMAPTSGGTSAYFCAINRNKGSVVLDLDSPGARADLERLLEGADVLVTNLRLDSLRRHALDADSVLSAHPHIVYADISAYGSSGPEASRSGYDSVLQARSGVLAVTGEPTRPPVRVGVSILDMGSGLWLALGVVAALRDRDGSGRGTRVSTSLLEVGASFMSYHLAALQLSGTAPSRQGTGHPSIEPYGVLPTAEGGLSVGVGGDRVFERFARALGARWLAEDPRFSTNPARVEHRGELRRELVRLLSRRTARQWEALLADEGVPASLVASVADVLDDPQLEALGIWLGQETGSGGPEGSSANEVKIPGAPVTFGGMRPPLRKAPPSLDDSHDRLPPASPGR